MASFPNSPAIEVGKCKKWEQELSKRLPTVPFWQHWTGPPNSSPVQAFLWRSWNPLEKFPRTWRMRPSSKSPPENGRDFPSALPNSCYLKPFCSISCLHFGLVARIPSTSFQVIQSFFLRSNNFELFSYEIPCDAYSTKAEEKTLRRDDEALRMSFCKKIIRDKQLIRLNNDSLLDHFLQLDPKSLP